MITKLPLPFSFPFSALVLMTLIFGISTSTLADTTHVNSTKEGELLFKKHCTSCHGVNGTGSIGLPLSKPSVIQSMTNDYIHKTIRSGRPGRLMPAFSKLSDDEVEAITKFMRTWGEVKLITDTAETVIADPAKGKLLYTAHCQQCHGEQLQGSDEGTGVTFSRERKLAIMAPALNNPGFQDAISDHALLHIIQQGREGTPMLAYKERLSHTDTHHLISYIRSQKKTLATPKTGNESFTIIVDSPHSFDETVKLIQETVRSYNFRVFPNRFLEQGLTDEFSVNKRQIIIRFCNFNKLYAALKIEPRIGTLLPCKITIIENEDGSVQMVYTHVEAVSKIFNNDLLAEAFKEIEESYSDIIDEVTL